VYRKVILLMLSVMSGCCVAEPTREEQKAVEAKFLQSLIAQNFIAVPARYCDDGSQEVRDAVEYLLLQMIDEHPENADFALSLQLWQATLIAELVVRGIEVDDSAEVSSLEAWVNSNSSVPLSKIMEAKGFIGSWHVIYHFYKNFALVYYSEPDVSVGGDRSLSILGCYVNTVRKYNEKAALKDARLAGVFSFSAPGSSPRYASSSPRHYGQWKAFSEAHPDGAGLASSPRPQKGVKVKRGKQRSYTTSVKAETSFEGCGAGSPAAKRRCDLPV